MTQVALAFGDVPWRNRHNSGWTEARTEELKALIAARYSMGEAAAKLGITRSAVAGKKARLGLKSFGSSSNRLNTPKHRRQGGGILNKLKRAPAKPVVSKPLPTSIPEPRLVSIEDLDFGRDCRWPYGNPQNEPVRYCGHPRITPFDDGSSVYCAAHHALSCTPDIRQRGDPFVARGYKHR